MEVSQGIVKVFGISASALLLAAGQGVVNANAVGEAALRQEEACSNGEGNLCKTSQVCSQYKGEVCVGWDYYYYYYTK